MAGSLASDPGGPAIDMDSTADKRLVFVDCETTGLDPSRHEVYEIAAICDGEETLHAWLPVDVGAADADALRISGYYEREPPAGMLQHPKTAAEQLARLTSRAHLVGINPAFDAAFLREFLRRHGYAPAWHYHLVDCLALAAGHLGLAPPWDSDELARRLGVPELGVRHTALADAEWARHIYRAVMGGGRR